MTIAQQQTKRVIRVITLKVKHTPLLSLGQTRIAGIVVSSNLLFISVTRQITGLPPYIGEWLRGKRKYRTIRTSLVGRNRKFGLNLVMSALAAVTATNDAHLVPGGSKKVRHTQMQVIDL